ncbi:TPA: hypothetical protein MG567_10580 [Klebsiella pneumoniae]|nr:hypothetical protein [Klebsiella pneumoniae]HBZ4232239.1 hypothetical protein [Klebsiella pneumoniae]
MLSLRLSSSERPAKDTTSSISNSPSLHLPENAGTALTSPSPWWQWCKALSLGRADLLCPIPARRKK